MRERLVGVLEEYTGLTVTPKSVVDRLSEAAVHFEQFRNEASELAYWTLDYFGGRPHEMQAERRKRLAQRSRIAFLHDPLAGAEANLLANFGYGQGVGLPDAAHPEVQKILDRAWNDPVNKDMMTGFAAQRRSSNSLLTQGELMDLLYAQGGRVRLAKLDVDQVVDVVPDPENRLRPIYFICPRRVFKWDVENDRPAFEMLDLEGGRVKQTYYPHWRNLRDAEEDRKGPNGEGLEPLPVIPPEKQDPGGAVVYHTTINQVDEQVRGNPPWARSLRFYSAMNQFTEARVAMAQAASTFIAKRVTKGSQTEIVKAAGQVLSQTGELGSARYIDDGGSVGAPLPGEEPGQLPPAPGSWWHENEQTKLESLSLQSGAQAAMADAQIIRAPLAAAAQFGQHYLGDMSNASLATATSLELPSLMAVLAWQQVGRERLTWFGERAIEAAIRAGELGGAYHEGDGRPLNELLLAESEDREELEKRTGKDLSFTISMPYPGRRNLPDVTSSLSSVLEVGDGLLAENEEFMEQALLFLFGQGWQLDDPARAVDRVMERLRKQLKEREEMAQQIAAGAAAGLGPGAPTPKPGKTGGQGGEPPGRTAPKTEMGAGSSGAFEAEWLPPELRRPVDEYSAQMAAIFDRVVLTPTVAAAKSLDGSSNGTGE